MDVLNNYIERYKSIRRMSWLKRIYNDKYAFIGLGNHSISNLYPVIDYLHVTLKYICCKSKGKIPYIVSKWQNVQAITSFYYILSYQYFKGVFFSISPFSHY